ncbi:hypothetical protein EDD16DRAFT_1474590 [Pisolithus croceorrhizus]|nr:hypothetical protein EV401DRAFT_1874162 [Pisolithus croceorrhizus]KAI6125012.1 hypothetical protein EDD16DRAFT_1474590 [Pisolithus croceorrhizus]KAI6161907.1 hypothetical protein EDD17DRAFT_1480316 [Pisolithus thermaeus]
MQNDYIHEWIPHKEDFLRILLELEAPSVPHVCNMCQKDGVYRCLDCMHQPLFCTDCCWMVHETHPFHRIQQWTGDFFEHSALHMTGLQLHLGHSRGPCPSASLNEGATSTRNLWPGTMNDPKPQRKDNEMDMLAMDKGEWEDIKNIPLHLCPPAGFKHLTIIDIMGVHFVQVQACQCVDAESYHTQLFWAKLFPSTFTKPDMAFTFSVLDDFLRDNVECRTLGRNYYSKLHQMTSSVFPHLVSDRYQELLQVMWQWCLLKLLKWSGFKDQKNNSTNGDLVLFCMACPQPGININPAENLDHWKYTRTVVMDGNFKVEHMHKRRPNDQAWLMDGCGFMVANPCYQEYLKATPHIMEKSTCNNHKVISQASANHGKLNSTGVGATACAWHGCFYPHSVVDFQEGERQLNMDYSLAHALGYNMNGIWNVICFCDINSTYMKNQSRQVDSSQFLHIPPSLSIVAGISMWHIHGHKKECYAQYSPLFIKGSGWVDGEIIEMLWSTLNIVSASTHGMTAPHFQELLDFQMNDSNFMRRLANLPTVSSVLQKLKAAQDSVVLAQEAFERLDWAIPSAQKRNWRAEEEAAMNAHIQNPAAMDIFEIQLNKAPTVHAIELHLLENSPQLGICHGATSWITHSLAIEEAEIHLMAYKREIGLNPSKMKQLALAHHKDKLEAK